HTATGDCAAALQAMREAEAIRDRDAWHAWRFFDTRLQLASAEYWLAQRDPDRAAEYAQRLLANCARQRVPKYIVAAHNALAEIALLRSDYAGAQAELTAALGQLQTHPAPLVAWKTYAAQGRLHQKAGDSQAAREAFVQSAAIVEFISANIYDESLRTI